MQTKKTTEITANNLRIEGYVFDLRDLNKVGEGHKTKMPQYAAKISKIVSASEDQVALPCYYSSELLYSDFGKFTEYESTALFLVKGCLKTNGISIECAFLYVENPKAKSAERNWEMVCAYQGNITRKNGHIGPVDFDSIHVDIKQSELVLAGYKGNVTCTMKIPRACKHITEMCRIAGA